MLKSRRYEGSSAAERLCIWRFRGQQNLHSGKEPRMPRYNRCFLAIAACSLLTFPLILLAQDNVEGPWGQANADNLGRARSDTIPLRFGTGTGGRQAWRLATRAVGSDRPRGRSGASMVFDAAGNIYWISDN